MTAQVDAPDLGASCLTDLEPDMLKTAYPATDLAARSSGVGP